MVPTPGLLPGKSHGQRSLVGCRPWGLEELDTTERLSSRRGLTAGGSSVNRVGTLSSWKRHQPGHRVGVQTSTHLRSQPERDKEQVLEVPGNSAER